jgi:hypothetical protein
VAKRKSESRSGRLKAENAQLKTQRGRSVSLKVSEKACRLVSTLHTLAEAVDKLLAMSGIRALSRRTTRR